MLRKFKQFKHWLICKIICRNYWKKLYNSESKNAYWEIWHDSDEKSIILHHVPEEDYTNKDTKIKLSYNQFDDLIKFIIRIS